jgi:hypothetical protein
MRNSLSLPRHTYALLIASLVNPEASKQAGSLKVEESPMERNNRGGSGIRRKESLGATQDVQP